MVKVAEKLTNYDHKNYILITENLDKKFGPVKDGVNFVITEEFPENKIFTDELREALKFPEKYVLEERFSSHQKLCDRYLLNEELFRRLKSFNSSLAVIDSHIESHCLAIIAYKLGIPFIFLGFENYIAIHRTPWLISVIPHFYLFITEITSFSIKIKNFMNHLQDYINPTPWSPARDIKEYAPGRPDISFEELLRQNQLYIVDSDYFLHKALPALPNVKYIGGIATQPAKPLKGKILEFVNASKHGVIVVSPGSSINWDIHLKKMEEAFSKIKYDVVWKHSNISFSRPNVLLTKWLPQTDLLGHPNTKLFITHCGNSGNYETLYNAVPIIGFPFYFDQPLNSQYMQMKGFGISMDLNNFTVDELVRNIEEVIENPKYKKNIAKMSEIFRSQDLPSARAARLVNEILKYGGDHLRSEIQDIPLYEFLMLDILAPLFMAGFMILFLMIFVLRKCFAIAYRKKKTKTE